MWMTSIIDNEKLLSVVFLLSDTLRGVLSDGRDLVETGVRMPPTGSDASAAEVFAKLERHRQHMDRIRCREALLIARLSRAREWAKLLKRVDPDFKPEINIFLLGTVYCEDLKQAYMPNVQSDFNGGRLTRRFVADRLREADSGGAGDGEVSLAYIVAGKVAITDLLAAAEAMLAALDRRYGLYEGMETPEMMAEMMTQGEGDGTLMLSLADMIAPETDAEAGKAGAAGVC